MHNARRRKSFIRGLPLIFYGRAQRDNRAKKGKTDDDWQWLNDAILHYAKVGGLKFNTFKQQVERNFESRNIKGLIDYNSINTIRNYTVLINLYPDKPAYYNELGIAYRLNKQLNNAITTFERALVIEPKGLPSLNELGITYRENNQADEAIAICLKAIKMHHSRHPYLNLLQIYLFFKPDTQKARENFTILSEEAPRLKAFNSSRTKYKQIIDNLSSIWNISFNDLVLYERFLFLAIQYKAYLEVLPILQKLDEKFLDNAKLKSRLGKTLSNQVIDEYEKGQRYLKQAIALFKKENNRQQLQQHILYYCYSLNNHQQLDLLAEELQTYKSDLIQDADYFRFMGHYSFAKHQDLPKAINYFEQAIKMAEEPNEQREYAETLLRLLSEQNSPRYKDYFVKYQAVL